MTDRDRRFNLTLAGIVAFALTVRIVFVAVFDNIYSHEAEAYSKLNLVTTWIDAGMPYPDVNFGPLHTWLIYLLTLPFDSPVLPVRIFSISCGVLAIIPYALLVRMFFEDRVALSTALLFSLCPVHLRGSVTTLALAPYVLFVGIGLYYYFRYKTNRRPHFYWLAIAALFLNMAGMLRFEAWLLLPLLCIFLIRKNFFHAVLFGAMNLAFPLVHMWKCYTQTGNPMAFAVTSATSFLQYMPMMPLSYKLTGWFVSFAGGITAITAACAGLGLLVAVFARKGFHFAMLFIFVLAIMQYKTLTNTIDPSLTRYTAGMSLLLLPFASLLLWTVAQRFFRRGLGTTILGICLVAILALQMLLFSTLQSIKQTIPDDIKQTVAFLRENVKPTDRVLADSRFHPYFMVESRLQNRQFLSLRFSADRKHLDEPYLAEMIQTRPPTFAVLDYQLLDIEQVNSNLDAFDVPQNATTATSNGLKFDRLAAFGDFVIFAVAPEFAGGAK
jgi:4-amino-4-deoxy-L-arabinose transferase-like glycosyltransferase